MTHAQKHHRPFSVLPLLCSSQHPYEVGGMFIFQIKPRLRKVTQSRALLHPCYQVPDTHLVEE